MSTTNLEIAYSKINESGLSLHEKKCIKLEAAKNSGIAEGIKLENCFMRTQL